MPVSSYRNTVYAPFQCLGAQALPLDVPSQRHETFGRNINIGVGLGHVRLAMCRLSASDTEEYLNRVQDFYDARVSQSAQLLQGVFRKG